ncbi:MAG: PilZ domain-containing protein [Gammaproteobacteria bacterium]|nr:PilZ domain-containing protein [Gammaproteobacteria bacterium]
MGSTTTENHQGGLVIEPYIGLAWKAMPANTNQQTLFKNNLLTLSLLDMLQEQRTGHDIHPHGHSLQKTELQHIDAKLNLLLGLVTQLLNHDQAMPEFQTIKFSIDGIEWYDKSKPELQQTLLLDIYLDTENHHALKLPATVENISTVDSGYMVKTRFLPLSEEVKNHLEKWIFRQHRREVAQARGRT